MPDTETMNRAVENMVRDAIACTGSEININIKDKAPCEYMDRMKQQIDGNGSFYGGIVSMDDLQANLEENCIPECFRDMDVNDYKAFLAMRRKMIAQYIRNYYENLE